MFRSALVVLASTLAFTLSSPSEAQIIEDEMSVDFSAPLGISNTAPWTRVRFSETSFAVNDGVLTMTTGPNRGTWFGNGTAIGHHPGWSFSTSAVGTYIDISLKLGADSEDWSLYFHDASGYEGALGFNPAGSYNAPIQFGVSYFFAGAGNIGTTNFVTMDLSDDFHRFEILLKDGMVSYAIDGELAFSGAAFLSTTQQLLVIGDGSGSTPTGLGSMQVERVHIDTAPEITSLAAVPVPGALPLLGSALAFGGLWRRRRTRQLQ